MEVEVSEIWVVKSLTSCSEKEQHSNAWTYVQCLLKRLTYILAKVRYCWLQNIPNHWPQIFFEGYRRKVICKVVKWNGGLVEIWCMLKLKQEGYKMVQIS
ncbi:hypothetical protein RDI58_013135 [Solanum bulbocastanum]|uniref:Uncharacterized protein n=1 Tax=Solanum bulbocastanum TaxID=147425 RepID=A0AAN8TT07_SOLBU